MEFRIAQEEDDRALRALAAKVAVPGSTTVIYGREPSFFHGLDVLGDETQCVVAVDDGAIVGVGCRSIRPMFINGMVRNFGYLSGLKLLPEMRGGRTFFKGMACLRELHSDGRVPAYVTTVIESNARARALLTCGRCGVPTYVDLGRFVTYALNVPKRPRSRSGAIRVRPGSEHDLEEIVDFVNAEGMRRQFAPLVRMQDFASGRFRGLRKEDLLIASLGGEVVGTLALWDQRDFKQSIVSSYGGMLGWTRGVGNLLLSATGYHGLPEPGVPISMLSLSLIRVRNDDVGIFTALLDGALVCAQERGCQYAMVGVHESDPLAAVLARRLSVRYRARLYLVCFDDSSRALHELGRARVPYLELACL